MSNFLSAGIEPSLIHGVDMLIQRVDLSSTNYDEVLREPTGEVQYLPAEEIFAQIHWKDITNKSRKAPFGDDPDIDGWITMRKSDLEDLEGGMFKKSDKLIEIDEESYEEEPLYIHSIGRKGHYLTTKLIMFPFSKRDKSRR